MANPAAMVISPILLKYIFVKFIFRSTQTFDSLETSYAGTAL